MFRLSMQVVVVVSSGCTAMLESRLRHTLIPQAAFDHDCPIERTEIVGEDAASRGYRLNVCGKERRYRVIALEQLTFIDVTAAR